jgi:DNA-binding transcriptional regulator LsrR (DeoR family)
MRYCWIPLPRPQLDEKQQAILKRVRESWTGITREQLEQCVARGYSGHPTSRPPGCILLAVGEQKARTVYQAVVKEHLANHLFIDYECAEELDRQMGNL